MYGNQPARWTIRLRGDDAALHARTDACAFRRGDG